MKFDNHQAIILHDEIESRIAELKGQGISQDKFALAYARVSTEHNEQKGSKENQVEDCRKYAERQGLCLVYDPFECTESAKEQGRKIFNTLIETALHYNIKNIILKDTSRLTRNLGDKEKINQLVKKDKIQVHFYLTNDILTSESRMLISNILAIVDADFSELLSVKMKHAAKIRKEKGIPYHAPIGYRFGKDDRGETDTSRMEFDPAYEKTIKEIINLFLNEHKTCEEIADILNAMGYHTCRNNKYYASTIHRILVNKAYTGKYFLDKGEWKPIKIPCPAYIIEEEYNEIQRRIKLNSKGSKKRRQESYLLTGLILCDCCNSIASGNRPNGHIYYSHKCKSPESNPKPYWTEKSLLKVINQEVEKVFYDEKHTETLKIKLKKLIHSKSTVTGKLKDEINQRIKKLERRKEVLLDCIVDETISKEDYKRKNAEIEEALISCKEKLNSLSCDLSEHYKDAEKVIDGIRNFTKLYKDAFDTERILLLREMVSWIRFDGKEAVIEWKKPFDILLSTDENLIQHPATLKKAGNIILSKWVDKFSTIRG